LAAESIPPIDIHHVRKLFMGMFVYTSVAFNVELNVSAMQTSNAPAEWQVAQESFLTTTVQGKGRFCLSEIYIPLMGGAKRIADITCQYPPLVQKF
jgi:hypothetical protein